MITSKLTSKSQTTIPMSVRTALGLEPGDLITYEILDGRVTLMRGPKKLKTEDPFGSFEEWHGKNDEEAYAEL